MSTINLGSFYSSGGKTVISGGSSNLDTQALIKGLAEAKRLPAVRLEATIEQNTSKSDALTELKGILDKFKDSANFLRNPPGLTGSADNIFSYRSAAVSANTGSAESYLSTSVATGTQPSSYTITVDQIATKQTRVTNTFALADMNAQAVGGGGPFNAGTLKLGAGLTPITLTNGDTLSDVMSKINSAKATSGVEVNAVKVSNGNYRLVFKATQTGTDQNFDFTANNAGILNTGFLSETDAVNANVSVDGTQVTRQTNTVNDLIDGVTLTLKQVTPPAVELTVDVKADTELAKSAIINFVDAYNEFRVFASKQTETNDDGDRTEGAVLGTNNALRTLVNSIGGEISKMVNGLTSGPNSLASLGIKLSDFAGDDETPFTRNILKVNDTDLENALAADFDAARKVFEFDYSSDSPNMIVYARSNALNATQVSYNIDQTNGVYEATYDNGGGPQTITLTATPLSSGGVSLKAADGSALEGLTVLYTATDDTVVNLNMTQGIGDRMFNILDKALNEENGIVQQELQSLDDRNTRLEQDIARIDEMVEKFRQSLLERFSALESAVASVNSILQMLEAQADARANG